MKTLKAREYAIRLYGQEEAEDLRVVSRSLWRAGYTIEEIAEAYNVKVEDLRINTITPEEAVKELYKGGLSVEDIAFLAFKSIEWVNEQLRVKSNKRVKARDSHSLRGLSIAAKTAY